MLIDEQKKVRYSRQMNAFQHIINRFNQGESLKRVLVLGCGNGLEALFMHKILGAQVYGVDIVNDFSEQALRYTALHTYDGVHLPFADGFFDAVYSYHVLEHVENVSFLLQEVRRVLHHRGFVYIGVPNKSRLIGYLGMNDKSPARKVKQNINDWWKRLKGEWDNAKGAHAGFAETELITLARQQFRQALPVTQLYYLSKWRKFTRILRWIQKGSLYRVILPSVYIMAMD